MSLHVETAGSGADLVLVHGWGMHGGVWDGVKEALTDTFRLHVVDLPGYGASAPCAPYTLERVVGEIAAVLPQKALLCGWSLGGLIAVDVARRFPQKVARLALVASTPCFAQREDWPCAMAPQTLGEFAADLDRDDEGTLKRFLALQARGDEVAKAVLRSLRADLFARGRPAAAALRGGLEILQNADLREHLPQLPTLVMHGDRDQLVPLAAAQWLTRQVPGARLEVFGGAAHAPFLSQPQEFIAALRGFLTTHG